MSLRLGQRALQDGGGLEWSTGDVARMFPRLQLLHLDMAYVRSSSRPYSLASMALISRLASHSVHERRADRLGG